MNVTPEIPPWLEPDDESDPFASLGVLGIHKLVNSFAQEFEIDFGLALITLLAGAAHSLGGAVRIDSNLGLLEAPFSLLLVTPELDPIWPRIPILFLTDGISQTLPLLVARENQETGSQNSRDGGRNHSGYGGVSEVAKKMYIDQVAERITTRSIVPPFSRLPFDHHVLLINPPNGLIRGFRQMSVEDKVRLENALQSNQPILAGDDTSSAAVPSFYWTIPRNEAGKLLKENPWLAEVPFLMLESESPGGVRLDPSLGCVVKIYRQHIDLYTRRHNAIGNGHCYPAQTPIIDPIREFLVRAQTSESTADQRGQISAMFVAELALRIALLFTALDGKSEPDKPSVECGLAVARQLAIRHCRTLSAYMPETLTKRDSVADFSILDRRERAVFLRICERPGITASELSRSLVRLRKDERDRILVTLIGRDLVRLEGGRLWQA